MKPVAATVGALFFAVLTLSGCPNKGTTEPGKPGPVGTQQTTPSGDRTVTITSISPDTDKPLRAGSTAKLVVAVDYVVPAPGGIVGVVIQDSNNASVKSNLREVPSGSGKLTSEIEFVVPNATHLNVHVPLYVKGDNKSSHVAVKKFQVSPK